VICLRAGHPEAENVPNEDYRVNLVAAALRFHVLNKDFAEL
jgi:hypothetical protein